MYCDTHKILPIFKSLSSNLKINVFNYLIQLIYHLSDITTSTVLQNA